MIILSDCLTQEADEGCLKTAVSLTSRLKRQQDGITVISYGRRCGLSDIHMKLNRLFLNRRLFGMIWKQRETVFYIPFASNTAASSFRTLLLSLASGGRILVLFALRHPMGAAARFFLRRSKATVLVLSQPSLDFYKSLGIEKVIRLRVGVDTKRFFPVSQEEKVCLREKYGVSQTAKVVLHVGHLKKGRNIERLLEVSKEYQILLVVSSTTIEEQDLRMRMEKAENIRIVDTYLERIEELYQISDVYFFPVTKMENCIDSPLSVLEAAACGLPIIAAEYEGLADFVGQPGFLFLHSLSAEDINSALQKVLSAEAGESRKTVQDYDWKNSITTILQESEVYGKGKTGCANRP